jgi:hypothetical protein
MSAETPRKSLIAGLGLALIASLGAAGCKAKEAAAAGYDATTDVAPLGASGAVVSDAGIDATAAFGTAGGDTTGGAAAGGAAAGGTAGGTGTAGATADPGVAPSMGGAGSVGGSVTVGGSAAVGGSATATPGANVKAPVIDETPEPRPTAKGIGASGGPAGREDLRPDKSPCRQSVTRSPRV